MICPIQSCKIFLLNKNSLTNHLRKSSDVEHLLYYNKNIAVKPCLLCKRPLRNSRKLKNEEGLCHTCFKSKYLKKSSVKKKWLLRLCFRCKKEVLGYFSPRNTRVLCHTCLELRKVNKKIYDKEFDKKRYEKGKKDRSQKGLQKKTEQLKVLQSLLKDDLLKTIPIHEICKKYNISLLSIRKILPVIMTVEEYKKRNSVVRSRSVQLRIDDLRNFLKNNPNARNLKRTPNLLEKNLGEQIREKFPEITLRYNVWKSLKDDENNCYIHLESDIVLNFDDIRVIILIDGEAFHGKACYFNGDTVEKDEWKSRILFKYNPFVIRYSETEVKGGFALKHLSIKIDEIRSNKILNYYRNWMMHGNNIKRCTNKAKTFNCLLYPGKEFLG